MTHRCPVKGHDHETKLLRVVTQHGSGLRADLVECPTGLYRWLVLHGRELSDAVRMRRPRFGWRGW